MNAGKFGIVVNLQRRRFKVFELLYFLVQAANMAQHLHGNVLELGVAHDSQLS